MEKIKLSELDLRCYIIHGSKNRLAYAERLLYEIYNKKRLCKNNIAIINGKNYKIIIDVKKEDIIEGFKCWVCDKYLGETKDANCPDHSVYDDENYAPEYVHLLKVNKPNIFEKIEYK